MEARVGGAGHQALIHGVELPRHAVMETVGRWATRYPDGGWIDLLAVRATRGRWCAGELVRRVEADMVRDSEVESTDLACFAWLLATMAATPEEYQAAYRLFHLAMNHSKQPTVPRRVWNTWLQIAYIVGELDSVATGAVRDRVHPDTWWAVHTDAQNPFLHAAPPGDGTWLDRLSQPFTAGDAVPLMLREVEAATPFDRLTTASAPPRDGPLISVVMPVFNPTASLRTAAASIFAQTWGNLELILVDDASATGTEHLDAVAAMDPRVRLVRTEQNAGAYAARNRGIAVARGTLLTFQDADDFAHAQRLERQADAILSDDTIVTSLSLSVRATDQLAITNLGYRLVATNLSSIMFRREAVLRRLGGYDPIRRGADTEFLDRVQQVFGTAALRRIEHAFAVVQLTPRSLSRGEMGVLHRHIARGAYLAAARGWHTATRARGRDPHVQPPARPPFPAPAHVSGSPTGAVLADVVLLAPVEAGVAADIGPLAESLVAGGHRVAVKEYVGPGATLQRLRGVGPTLGRLLAEERVRWLMPTEVVHARIAIVHDPGAVLTMPEEVLAAVTAAHFVVVAATARAQSQVQPVDQRLRKVTGRPSSWLPATETIGTALSAADATVLPPAFWHVSAARPRPWRGAKNPVVGLLSPRLIPYPVPDGGRLVPADERTSVWSFGPYPSRAHKRGIARLRADPLTWPYFLAQLSAFIGAVDDSIPAPVLDAWTTGTVVVASVQARPVLGTKALYVGDGHHPDMDSVLQHLAADPLAGAAVTADASAFSSTWASASAVQRTLSTTLTHLEAR